ncbi:hypothetical protein C8R45DRAFT_1111652 [Mycena sanguinolenta]|nr:hypothetical protein C8R45DRAFT_1111652 [Mycena sanguinolenta]
MAGIILGADGYSTSVAALLLVLSASFHAGRPPCLRPSIIGSLTPSHFGSWCDIVRISPAPAAVQCDMPLSTSSPTNTPFCGPTAHSRREPHLDSDIRSTFAASWTFTYSYLFAELPIYLKCDFALGRWNCTNGCTRARYYLVLLVDMTLPTLYPYATCRASLA